MKLMKNLTFLLLVALAGYGLYDSLFDKEANTTSATIAQIETSPAPTRELIETQPILITVTPVIQPTATLPNVIFGAEVFYTFDPSIDPSIDVGTLAFKDAVEFVVVTSGYIVTGTTLESVFGAEKPALNGLGPPCIKGEGSWLTGYDWWEMPPSGYRHKGVDIACNLTYPNGIKTFTVAAPTDCTITAIIGEEWRSQSYASSGVTVLCSAIDQNGTVLHFGMGHMDAEGLLVGAGQQLKAGDPIGIISKRRWENGVQLGTTGTTTGPHCHCFVVIDYANGQREWLNPRDFGLIGNRP